MQGIGDTPGGRPHQAFLLSPLSLSDHIPVVLNVVCELMRLTGAELERSYWLALLAAGYGKGGQVEAGLRTLEECWWEAERHRLKVELLLLQ